MSIVFLNEVPLVNGQPFEFEGHDRLQERFIEFLEEWGCRDAFEEHLSRASVPVEVAVMDNPNLGFMAAAKCNTVNRQGVYTLTANLANLLKLSETFGCESVGAQLGELMTHELCHIEQMADGRLVSDESGVWWEGVHYSPRDINPYRVDYLDLPWEAEAHLAGIEYAVGLGLISSVEEGMERLKMIYAAIPPEQAEMYDAWYAEQADKFGLS